MAHPSPHPHGAQAERDRDTSPSSAHLPQLPSQDSPTRSKPLAIRHDFCQTATHVTLTVYLKGATRDIVSVVAENYALNICCSPFRDLPKGFTLSLDPLFSKIDSANIKVVVTKFKIEVMMPKALSGPQWEGLHLHLIGEQLLLPTAPPSSIPPAKDPRIGPLSKRRSITMLRMTKTLSISFLKRFTQRPTITHEKRWSSHIKHLEALCYRPIGMTSTQQIMKRR